MSHKRGGKRVLPTNKPIGMMLATKHESRTTQHGEAHTAEGEEVVVNLCERQESLSPSFVLFQGELHFYFEFQPSVNFNIKLLVY